MVETITDNGTLTQGTYKRFSANEKASLAKLRAKYGVFLTIYHFTKICNGPNCPLKEATFLVDKLNVMLFKCSGPYILVNIASSHKDSTSKESTILASAIYNY